MNTVMVFTSKEHDIMFEEGGSGDWSASKTSILNCKYIIAAKSYTYVEDFGQKNYERGTAFLIGKISGVIDSPNTEGRLTIQFSEYANINLPNAWTGDRNPVRYIDIEELEQKYPEFSVRNLEWIPFPKNKIVEVDNIKPLTINEAKLGLAKFLGIDISCIEIKINA